MIIQGSGQGVQYCVRGWVLCCLWPPVGQAQVSWLYGMCGPRSPSSEQPVPPVTPSNKHPVLRSPDKWLPAANKSDRLEKSQDNWKNAKLWNVSYFDAAVIDLGTMFKWKVSGLGSKKEKSKSQQQTRLNNEPPTPEQDSNKNNKAKESNKKEK